MKSGGLRASSVNQSIVEEVKVIPKKEEKQELKDNKKQEIKKEEHKLSKPKEKHSNK